MNNKGQIGWVIVIMFALIFGIILGLSLTGKSVDEPPCTTREAKYSIIGSSEFSGKGLFNGKFSISLRNDEEQAAKFKVNMYCNTASKSEYIYSSEFYVQPNTVQEFPMIYAVGVLEDWKCVLSSVDAETINTCNEIN